MPVTTNRVPVSVADDPADVVEALDVARSLWESGERADAIRWVRRAVDAADEAGQTSRVAALARAAAELEDMAVAPAEPTSQTRPASRPATPQTRSIPPPLPSTRPAKPTSIPVPPRSTPSSVQSVRPAPVVTENRVRVSVRISARDEALYVVRPLPEGQAPPPGTREAFLIMPEETKGAKGAKGNVA